MGIQNFPLTLQPIIQQGFLAREFEQAIRSRLGYRACADREAIAVGIGETLTKTRAGLKPSVTVPIPASFNTNLDNGLVPTGWGVEQYTLSINHYASTTDLNMVTSRVGIASQFLQNAYVNGEQAARSLDELARNALFSPYFGGNTRIRTTLASAAPQIAVDDVRGFQTIFVSGVQSPVSSTSSMTITVGSNTYTLVGTAVDLVNASTAPGGMSGVLTLSGNVSVQDATAGNTVQAATASVIMRPNRRTNTSALVASDVMSMDSVLDAVAALRMNAVPDIGGAYNCYLDPVSARQLFADPDFQRLFVGLTSANEVFRPGMGVVNEFLGVRFVLTTEAYVQAHPVLAGAFVRRPIMVGQGALIEGDFAGMTADDVAPHAAEITLIDGVAMVTREPLDRLQQIISQSWYWIGGFCAPSDTTTTSLTVPTATNAAFKRAVMIEHIG
ncbi:MAG: hypothetical protein ACRYG8_07595 [Janthinobacterium lividum]